MLLELGFIRDGSYVDLSCFAHGDVTVAEDVSTSASATSSAAAAKHCSGATDWSSSANGLRLPGTGNL